MLRRLLRRRTSGRRRAVKVEKPTENAKAPQISAIVAMALAHGLPYSYVDLNSLDGTAPDGADGSGEMDDPTDHDGEP
jgi:hypothetical protein